MLEVKCQWTGNGLENDGNAFFKVSISGREMEMMEMHFLKVSKQEMIGWHF